MGISSGRDLGMLLAIQATDQASATIDKVNGKIEQTGLLANKTSLKMFGYSHAFSVAGQGLTHFGQAVAGVATAAGKMALDFDHQMASVQTQAQLTGKQFKDLGDAALQISNHYGVAATDIANGLYEVFSSMNVNYQGAIKITKAITGATVAGSTDMQTASRGVIQVLNAFGLKAGDVNKVLDDQFQLLRSSSGTYQELVSSFSNVTGAARATEQSLSTVSGAIAFLTKQGRTQAQASISVSRALDQLQRDAGDFQKAFGFSVYDAQGNFKDLGDIIDQMAGKMKGLSTEEQSAMFKQAFGAGSIQANRFFRAAIANVDQFDQSMTDLTSKNSAGQFAKQLDIMEKSDPSFVFHQMIETMKNVGITIFNTFLPAWQTIGDALKGVADWISNLSPGMQKLAGIVILFSGAVALVSGKLLTLISTFAMTKSILDLAGLSFSAAYGPVLLILGGVTLLAGAALLIIKYWGPISEWWHRNWEAIKDALVVAAAIIVPIIMDQLITAIAYLMAAVMGMGSITGVVSGVFKALTGIFMSNPWMIAVAALILVVGLIITHWDTIKRFLIRIWNDISKIASAVWGAVSRFFTRVWNDIYQVASTVWNAIKNFFVTIWHGIYEVITTEGKLIYGAAVAIWHGIYTVLAPILGPIVGFVKAVFKVIVDILIGAWKTIRVVTGVAWKIIYAIISTAVGIIVKIFQVLWNVAKTVWDAIYHTIVTVIHALQKAFDWFANIVKKVWDALWSALKSIWQHVGEPVFNGVKQGAIMLWHGLQDVWHGINKAWQLLWSGAKWAWDHIGKPLIDGIGNFFHTVADRWGNIWDTIKKAFLAIWTGIKSAIATVLNPIISILNFFLHGFRTAIDLVRNIFGMSDIGEINIPAIKGGLAKGTDNWQGGLAVVGEQGPELAYLPQHTVVMNHTESQKLMREAALPNLHRGSDLPGFAAGTGTADAVRSQIIQIARSQLGVPYVWGGSDPAGGGGAAFDCSGLTQYVLGKVGINLAHHAATQYQELPHVSGSQMLPGDLAFYDFSAPKTAAGIGHVGIYAGNGRMIDAPHTGASVRYDPVYYSALVGGGSAAAGKAAAGFIGSAGFEQTVYDALSSHSAGALVGWALDKAGVKAPSVHGITGLVDSGANLLSNMKNWFVHGAIDWSKKIAGDVFDIGSMDVKLPQSMIDAISHTVMMGGAIGLGAPVSGPVQHIVSQVATRYGWGSGAEWSALSKIISSESGWNPNAQNPTSTAYGLFQFLDSTWAGKPFAKTSDPYKQAVDGMIYIKQRYHDPIGAWNFHTAHGWYGDGLDAVFHQPTRIGVAEKGPERVTVEPLDHSGRARGGDGGVHLHIHGKYLSVDADQAVHELDWWRRTRGRV